MSSLPPGQDAQTPEPLSETAEALRRWSIEVLRKRYQVFLERAKLRPLTDAELHEAEKLELILDTLQAMERPQGS